MAQPVILPYEPTIWHNWDLPAIDKDKLNKIENALKTAYDALAMCLLIQTDVTSGIPGQGWYRIATNGSCTVDSTSGTRAIGEFIVFDNTPTGQSIITFKASYTSGGAPVITMLDGASVNIANSCIKRIRMVYGTGTQGAAVELYCNAAANELSFMILSNDGWDSIPFANGGANGAQNGQPGTFQIIELDLDTTNKSNPVFGIATSEADNALTVVPSGDIYVKGNNVWHRGNMGHGKELDADTIDGLHLATGVDSLDARFVNTAGGDTMAGPFIVNGTFTVNDATTLNSTLDMSSHKITHLATPVLNNDAATKEYVDMAINGLDWQESVLSKSYNVPQAGVTGARYIIKADPVPTGDWTNGGNKIVEYLTEDGTNYGWKIHEVDVGTACWVVDEGMTYVWNNTAWVRFGSTNIHNNLSLLQGGDGNDQFYHLNYAEYTALRGGGSTDATSMHIHDSRYYTETESNNKFVVNPGDVTWTIPINGFYKNGFLKCTDGIVEWAPVTGGAGVDADTLDGMQPHIDNYYTAILGSIVQRNTSGYFQIGSIGFMGGSDPNYFDTKIQASSSQAGAITYTLPAAGGVSSEWSVLANNGNNQLQWQRFSSSNVVNAIVNRDSSGNFSAGTITAALIGNSTTATTLQNARNIAIEGDVSGTATAFNGSANISIPSTVTKINGVAPGSTYSQGTASVVLRDTSGNFTAHIITADLNGNATTATSAGSLGGVAASSFVQKSLNDAYTDNITCGVMGSSGFTARLYASAVSDGNGNIYVIGGALSPVTGAASNKIEVYDVSDNSWNAVPLTDCPISPIGTYHCAAGYYNGYIYYIGGDDGYGSGGNHVAYTGQFDPAGNDGAGTWTAMSNAAPPFTGWSGVAHAQIGSKIYVMGGYRWNGSQYVYNSTGTNSYCYTYDMANPNTAGVSWEAKNDMPVRLVNAEAVAVNGIIYVFGGRTVGTTSDPYSGAAQTTAYKYDPAIGLWWPIASLPEAKVGHIVAAFGSYIYIIGGGATTTSVYRYDPLSDTYETLPSLPTATWHDPLVAPTFYGTTDGCAGVYKGAIYAICTRNVSSGTASATNFGMCVGHVLTSPATGPSMVGVLSASRPLKAIESSQGIGLRGAVCAVNINDTVYAHNAMPEARDVTDGLQAKIWTII